MTIAINNRTFVGLGNLTLTRLSDGVVLSLPKPSRFVLATGLQQRIQLSRDEQGREVRVRSYATGSLPELTVSYNHLNSELIGFSLGNQFAQGTFAQYLPRLLNVTKGEYPAKTTGLAGFGVVADVVDAVASITKDNLTFPLTQAVFADYATWRTSPNTFAVGADGALAFSDDLVTAQQVVALSIPYSVTGVGLSALLLGDYRISATLVDTESQLTFFLAPSCSVNLDGGSFDPTAENLDIRFFVNYPAGECSAFSMVTSKLLTSCGN